jgi:hypothetical protein
MILKAIDSANKKHVVACVIFHFDLNKPKVGAGEEGGNGFTRSLLWRAIPPSAN